MCKICLFAGTTEGRKLTEFLSGKSVDLIVCVATEYGEEVLENHGDAKVIKKRLSEAEMLELFQSQKFDLVIDATHPYAVQVSENIKSACIFSGTEYQRILRDNSSIGDDALIFPDIESAIIFLNTDDGNILLTTGSKEISKYSGLLNFSKRVYARVLPMSSSLEACTAAGLKPAHIIAMQGPFSEEMNIATLKAIRAKWLVTKDSGDAGGFTEKASAAKKADAKMIVIGRPPQTEGINLSTCISELCERFEEHINNFNVQKFPFEEIQNVELNSNVKKITTIDKELLAKTIIIATGAKAKKLNIKGEKEFKGRGVSYCAVCDGAFYKNKVVAVIGGGNSALEEALYLTRFANIVYLIHRRNEFRADKIIQNRVFENKKIKPILNSVVEEIQGTNKVEKIILKNTLNKNINEINLDGIFIYIGLEPNSELFNDKLEQDKQGFIITDNTMQTSVDGVYAIGDVRNTPLRQVITAVSDGAIAGVTVSKYLIEKEKEHESISLR